MQSLPLSYNFPQYLSQLTKISVRHGRHSCFFLFFLIWQGEGDVNLDTPITEELAFHWLNPFTSACRCFVSALLEK